MTTPLSSESFADLLDPRFQRIFNGEYEQLQDMIPTLFEMPPDNGRNEMKWSATGALGDFATFTSQITYDSMSQGYDVTQTHVEFASGIQIRRKLFDDEQYNILDGQPRSLAQAAARTRQKHAARVFTNAFTNDSFFYSNSEGVALCSDSHTTTAPDTSTSSGFDNLLTSALSATAVAAARIQMVDFRDDRGNRMAAMPDELWFPPNLYEQANEIVKSAGKLDTAENNPNIHQGAYKLYEWNYMTDSNDWFMCDSGKRRQFLHWVDRIPLEFGMVEDFDTMVGKWRAYMRYSWAFDNWRWIIGSQVS